MKTLKPTTAGNLHLDQPELTRSDRGGSSESRLTYRWVILRRPGTSRKQTTNPAQNRGLKNCFSCSVRMILADSGSRNGSTRIRAHCSRNLRVAALPSILFAFILNGEVICGEPLLEGIHVAGRSALAFQSCHFISP